MEQVSLIECINTFQGEGPDSGKRMLLCRFKFCDRTCSWCDTMVKMRVQQPGTYSLEQLQELMNEEQTGLMITGGEPTFSHQLKETITMLNGLEYPVANVETNGLQIEELIKEVDDDKPVHYIFSPKIFNEDDMKVAEEKARYLSYHADKVYMKVVVFDDELTMNFIKNLGNMFPSDKVFLMPRGKNKEELLSNAPLVFDTAEKYKMCFSSRTHLIYDFV